MHKTNNKTTIIVLVAISIFVGTLAYQKLNNTKLVNKEDYKSFRTKLIEASPDFKNNEDFSNFIQEQTRKDNLLYITDAYGNIIVTKSATDNSAPTTVVVTDYNYKNAITSADALTAVHEVAASKTKSGSVISIFLNNEDNSHYGAKNINKSYIPTNSNVIYISNGKNLYISNASFASSMSDLSIPYSTETVNQNAGIRVKISGIKTDSPSSYISQQPDLFDKLYSVISKIKDKSVSYQIADLSLSNNGNMYPDSIEFTLLIDSYNLEAIQAYLDSQKEAFEKSTKKLFPDAGYTYEIISDESKLPKEAISTDTINSLSTFLYIAKNGNYRFEKEDKFPDKYEVGQVYATNTLEQLYVDGDTLHLTMNTTGLTNKYRDKAVQDISSAANLASLSVSTSDNIDVFENKDDTLSADLSNIYSNLNDKSAKTIAMPVKYDSKFTTASLLQGIQPKASITHINLDEDDIYAGIKITNTILNHINSYSKNSLFNF